MKLTTKSAGRAAAACVAAAACLSAFAHIPSIHFGMTTEEVTVVMGQASSQDCTRALGVATCEMRWNSLFGSGSCSVTTVWGRVLKWSCASNCN
jgi:hypothetical protein